jgi:hypothetical protein
MTSFRSVDAVHLAIAAALGLPSFACGGRATSASANSGNASGAQADANARDGQADGTTSDAQTNGGRRLSCQNAAAILIAGMDTGYDSCEGGTIRRRAVVDCPNLLPQRSTTRCVPPRGVVFPDSGIECTLDSECAARPNAPAYANCTLSYPGGCNCCLCNSGCVRDSDCASGQICLCADPIGECHAASCNAGTCGPGLDCASTSLGIGCVGYGAFACQTSGDACFSDSDCGQGVCILGHAGPSNTRVCGGSVCGRPFLVSGEARLAHVGARSDWRETGVTPDVLSLTPDARAHLAARWLDFARMEHASIAAFARFALQLLAVGAPPDLVLDAQRAMGDETNHTRLAFALASAYAGRDLGPGPLAVGGCLETTDLRALVSSVVAEGCIGETVAAAEAREALDYVREPAVQAVLEVIAADETRHAELAWRTVVWVLAVGGEEIRTCIESAITRETAALPAETCKTPHDGTAVSHGLIDDARRRRLRAAVLAEVVRPGLQMVLGRSMHSDSRSPRATAASAMA